MDLQTKKSLFLEYNQKACQLTLNNELDKAQVLLELAQQLVYEMPLAFKATFYSNLSCFHEKTNNDQSALQFLNQALNVENQLLSGVTESTPTSNSNMSTGTASNAQDVVGLAISYNNLAVLELKNLNNQAAFKASKNAVMTLEPKLFAEIKQAQQHQIDLRQEKSFLDRLQVLLIAYFNLGVSQTKVGNVQYARTVFEHGYKMGKKYMGEEHYFTQRFAKRISKPMGNNGQANRATSPQRSIKQDTSIGSGSGGQQQRGIMMGNRAQTGYGPMMSQDESEIIVDISTNNRAQSQMQQQQQMKVINKGDRKIITTLPQNPHLHKDLSGNSGLDSAHSTQNSQAYGQQQQQQQHNPPMQQQSKKKSELMQMVKDSHDESIMGRRSPPQQPISKQTTQTTDDIKRKKEELMKQLEEEFKVKQEMLQKQQEQETKKVQDLLSNLNQNQTDLSKKWEEFQKKQEDFEKKIAAEKSELVNERQRILEENKRVEDEKLRQLEKQKQEEKLLELEKQKLAMQAEQDQKLKQQQLQQELEKKQQDQLEKEKEKQMRELQEMMKNMQQQQEKYKQFEQQMQDMAKQQRDMEDQKRQMQLQQEKLEKEKQELAEKQQNQQTVQQKTSSNNNKADLNFNKQEKPKEEIKQQPAQTTNIHPFIRKASKIEGSSYNVLAKPEDLKDNQMKTLERLQSSSKLIKDVRKQGDLPVTANQFPTTTSVNNSPNPTKLSMPSNPSTLEKEELKEMDSPKSTMNNDKQGGPAISDVSSIKDSAKNGTNATDPIYTFTMEQLNEIIEEDIRLYDASIILTNEIVGAQFKTPKIVSQVIFCEGLYYKMYCEGCIGKDGKPIFKMHGICEDPKIQVMDEELIFFEMRSILNLIIVKDVLPPFLPIKNIRTFTDICKYFIFPFLLTTSENKLEENLTPDSNNNHNQVAPPQLSNRNSNERFIEIWGRSPGLLSQPTQIMILKNLCNVSLHYASDRYFKLAITSLDQESANSLYLDLYFDESSFDKYFQMLDPADFKMKDGQTIPTKEGEIKLPTIKIVDKDFLFEIEGALKTFENYLFNEFGQEVQFPYVVYERTGIIYQLRVRDEGNLQELWCVKDDQKAQCFEIICKTLYELRIKKHCIQQVERKMIVDYNQIWIIFGVPLGIQTILKDPTKKDDVASLPVDRSQHIMMAAYFLQTCFLHMPTMELNKGDLEDSDFEEEVNIAKKKIECIMHIRKLLDINGEKMPLTIQLMGYDNNCYLGIKVTAYNPTLIKETGVFLTVNQKYWELTDEQKHNLPKKQTMKTEILLDHYHIPDLLKRNGFLIIFNNLIIKKNEKTVKWKGPYGEAHVDVFESYFTRGSTSH
eukprot:403354508